MDDRTWEALAALGEEKERGRRQRAGERMTIGANGEIGGLGAPPGKVRWIAERLAAIDTLRTPSDLEDAKAMLLEQLDDGDYADAARDVSWPMIKAARGE